MITQAPDVAGRFVVQRSVVRHPDISGMFFSVIIPVFNGERFIADSIWSAQSQHHVPLQIIVVDDASQDRTCSLVERIAESDRSVVLIRNEVNRGPSFCRNLGIRKAATPLVAFLDADDQWLPDHLEQLAIGFAVCADARVAYTQTCSADALAASGEPAHRTQLLRAPFLEFLVDNPIPQSAAAAHRNVLIGIGGYREELRYAEDYDVWMRLTLAGVPMAFVPRATVIRSHHDAQASVQGAPAMFRNAWTIRRAAVESSYGHADKTDPVAVVRLLASQSLSISAALHRRRRDLLALTLELTQWIPAATARQARFRRLLGWKWYPWRTMAFVYDALPIAWQRWIRSQKDLVQLWFGE